MIGPTSPGSRALRPVLVLLAGIIAGCGASFGGSGGPSAGVSGAIGERDPGPSPESRREQRLRDALRALFRAEERYYADQGTYTVEIFHLRGDGGGGFEVPPGIRFRIPEANEDGFSAVAREAPFECALFIGEAEPPRGYVSIPGVIGCR
ncbi:MAG: hypothetical protein R3266_02210 [Gemmatimonadota bacterium]|nr:hypothetical protein [Gemmatimonadota bacterium]